MIALAVIAGLVILLCITRVGVSGGYGPGGVSLRLRFGVFRIRVLPAREKKEKKKKPKVAKPPKPAKEKPKGEKKPKQKYSFGEIMDLVRIGLKTGKKFLRGLRVDTLILDITAGGSDACATALLYGRICMALGIILPPLESVIRVRKRRIRVGLDYALEKPRINGKAALSISIGRIFAIGFSALFAFIKWRMNRQKVSAHTERGKAA